MIRTSLAAFLSLCFSVGLVAQASDAEPPKHELEAIVVNVMTETCQVTDYDTVKALLDELSPENKKFLQEVVAMSEVRIFNATDAPLASLEYLTFAAQDVDFSLGFPGKVGSYLYKPMPIARGFVVIRNDDNQSRHMWGVSVPHHSIRMHYPSTGGW